MSQSGSGSSMSSLPSSRKEIREVLSDDSTDLEDNDNANSTGDVSIMNTEPLDVDDQDGCSGNTVQTPREESDVSFLDTEPMDGGEGSSGSSQTPRLRPPRAKTIPSFRMPHPSPSGINIPSFRMPPPSPSAVSSVFTSFTHAGIQTPDSVEEEGEGETPLPDLTMAPSHERKRVYYDLLHKARDETVNSQPTNRFLKENISAAESLFQQMNATISQAWESQSQINYEEPASDIRTGLGSSASEVLLACTHTKAITEMLYQKVKMVGSSAAVFNLDEFLDNLTNAFVDDDSGEYNELIAVEKLAEVCDQASYKHIPFASVYNGMGRDGLLEANEPAPPKPVPVRIRTPRVNEKNGPMTESEIVNTAKAKAAAAAEELEELGTDTPEGLARDIVKTVKNRYRADGDKPQSLLEVCQADSVSEMVTRLFGAAFCARDGHLGVTVGEEDADGSEFSSSLMVHPEKPPQKVPGVKSELNRGQVIASYPVELLRMLAAKQAEANESPEPNSE